MRGTVLLRGSLIYTSILNTLWRMLLSVVVNVGMSVLCYDSSRCSRIDIFLVQEGIKDMSVLCNVSFNNLSGGLS